jgi:AcrR family transcriptional regulator
MSAARSRRLTRPRRLPTTHIGAQTVDAIFAAVEQLLEAEGPERLTTNRIAEVAGISIGSLYQYFPNKDAIVGALQDKYVEDTLSRIRAALADTEAMPIEMAIARVATAILAAKDTQRPIHRWLIDWRPASESADRYRERLDDEVELVADYLARRPELALADRDAVAFVLVHAIEGVVEAATERPHVDAQRVASAAVAMIAASLRAPRGSATV